MDLNEECRNCDTEQFTCSTCPKPLLIYSNIIRLLVRNRLRDRVYSLSRTTRRNNYPYLSHSCPVEVGTPKVVTDRTTNLLQRTSIAVDLGRLRKQHSMNGEEGDGSGRRK